MSTAQHDPRTVFANPLSTAAFLLERGDTAPFERGARFNLINGNGERQQIVHSAESLGEARDTLQAMGKVQGGEHVAQHASQNIGDARTNTGPQRN